MCDHLGVRVPRLSLFFPRLSSRLFLIRAAASWQPSEGTSVTFKQTAADRQDEAGGSEPFEATSRQISLFLLQMRHKFEVD